jgi:hypothetical protein
MPCGTEGFGNSISKTNVQKNANNCKPLGSADLKLHFVARHHEQRNRSRTFILQ